MAWKSVFVLFMDPSNNKRADSEADQSSRTGRDQKKQNENEDLKSPKMKKTITTLFIHESDLESREKP
jgi:hypothetical protein